MDGWGLEPQYVNLRKMHFHYANRPTFRRMDFVSVAKKDLDSWGLEPQFRQPKDLRRVLHCTICPNSLLTYTKRKRESYIRY